MMRIIDLTHILNSDISVYPGAEKPAFEQVHTIDKNGFAEVKITMYTHTGTHMDAPAHMIKGTKTLEMFKPEKFFGKAICIDCTKVLKRTIGKEHLSAYEEIIKQVDFVLFNTGWADKWKTKEYLLDYPTLSMEACEWLSTFDLKGIGMDAISVDAIDSPTMENHHIILGKGMVIIENLTKLHELNDEIFTFSCFPIKFENADGSSVRAVAIYND